MKINVKDSNLICGRSHIDGVWIDADSGETLDVINPATGDLSLIHI